MPKHIFEQNLKIIRNLAGIKQSELADAVGTTVQMVQHWEHGRAFPDLDTLIKLSDALKTPIETMVRVSLKKVPVC